MKMPIDNRCKDTNWNLGIDKAAPYRPDLATIAVLMDIRDELKSLNALLRREGLNLLRFPGKAETPQQEESGNGKS